MQEFFNYWFLQTLAMALTALLIPGLRVTSPLGPLLAAMGIAFMNATVWNAALFFSIPTVFSGPVVLIFLTNGVLFWVLVKLLPGIEITGILPAILAPVIFTVASIFIGEYGREIDWAGVFESLFSALTSFRDRLLPQTTS